MEALSTTTVRYLFASSWALPAGDAGWNVRVPDARVQGPDTAATLLNLAVWSLREQGLIELEQLRPVESERAVVMGGRSFTRARALDSGTRVPGLEGALLRQVRERSATGEPEGAGHRLALRISGDDPAGLRGSILGLGLSSGSPWASVVHACRDEARAAGIVEMRGRVFRKPVIADDVALDTLRERDTVIVAARDEYREREAELNLATISDCVAALQWAHTS